MMLTSATERFIKLTEHSTPPAPLLSMPVAYVRMKAGRIPGLYLTVAVCVNEHRCSPDLSGELAACPRGLYLTHFAPATDCSRALDSPGSFYTS
jgi:hypothetical protein